MQLRLFRWSESVKDLLREHDRGIQFLASAFATRSKIHGWSEDRELPFQITADVSAKDASRTQAHANPDRITTNHLPGRTDYHLMRAGERLRGLILCFKRKAPHAHHSVANELVDIGVMQQGEF